MVSKKSFMIIGAFVAFCVGGAAAQSTTSSALVGAALPTHCGAARGTNNITNQYPGEPAQPVDSAAKYYASQASGNVNSCVADIQRALNAAYCTPATKLVADGSYGAKTRTAITKLQTYLKFYNFKVNGAAITVDGKVGPQTWSLLSTRFIDTRYNPCA